MDYPRNQMKRVAAFLLVVLLAQVWTALGDLSGEVVASGATHVDSVQPALTSLRVPTDSTVYESELPIPVIRLSFDDPRAPGRNTGSLGRDLLMPTGGISTVADRTVGGALRFNGTARFRSRCQGLPSGNSSFSIAVWLSPENPNGGICSWGVAKKGECVGVSFQSGKGNFFFYGSDLSFEWASGFAGTDWAHVVCVWDPAAIGGNRQVYVNGTLAASDDPDLTPNVNLSPDTSFYLGNVLDVKEKVYRGRMADFRVYACALTASQASTLASGTPQGTDFIPSSASVEASGTGVIVNEIGTQTFAALSGNGTVETAEGSKTVLAVESPSSASVELRGAGQVEKTGAGKLPVRRLAVAGLDVKAGEVEVQGGCELARHVVAHWTFDAADPGFDSSGNGYRLVPRKGEATWGDLTNATPNAVTFAGASDVNVLVLNSFAAAKFASETATDFPSGNAAFTVSVRVKNEASQRSKNGIYSWGSAAKGRMNGLRTTGDGDQSDTTRYGYLHYNWGNDLAGDGATLVQGTTVYDNVWDGAWHHVVVTYDPSLPRRRIYSDGVLVAEDVPTEMAVDLSKFAIGRSLGSGSNHNYWQGSVDDVLVLDCAVAAEQVPLLASGDLSAFAKGGSALTVADGATFSVPDGQIVSLGTIQGAGKVLVNGTLAIGEATSLSVASLEGNGTVAAVAGNLTLSAGGTFAGTVAADDGAAVALDVGTDEKMSLGRIVGGGTLGKVGSGSVSVASAAELPAETKVFAGTLEVGMADGETAPVAHWSFSGERPLEDDDGKGWALVPNAGEVGAFASDVPGAVKLTGADYLCLQSCAALPSGDEAFTVSAWIMPERMEAKNSYLGVWSWGTPRTARAMNAFTLYYSLQGQMSGAPGYQHYAWSADLSVDSNPDDSVFSGDVSIWHNVTVTYDPKSRVRALYVDGKLRGQDVLAEGLSVASGTKFTLGAAMATGTDRPFRGYIGDFAIWRTALNADEVKSRYRAGEDGSTSVVQLTVAEDAAFAVRSGTCAVRSLAGGGMVAIPSNAELVFAPGGESSFKGRLSGEGAVRLARGTHVSLAKGSEVGRLVLDSGASLAIDVDGIKVAESSVVLKVLSFEGDGDAISVSNLPNEWKVRMRRRGTALIVSAICPGLAISIR